MIYDRVFAFAVRLGWAVVRLGSAHARRHVTDPAGGAFAPMLIPHIANNDGRLAGLPGDCLVAGGTALGVTLLEC